MEVTVGKTKNTPTLHHVVGRYAVEIKRDCGGVEEGFHDLRGTLAEEQEAVLVIHSGNDTHPLEFALKTKPVVYEYLVWLLAVIREGDEMILLHLEVGCSEDSLLQRVPDDLLAVAREREGMTAGEHPQGLRGQNVVGVASCLVVVVITDVKNARFGVVTFDVMKQREIRPRRYPSEHHFVTSKRPSFVETARVNFPPKGYSKGLRAVYFPPCQTLDTVGNGKIQFHGQLRGHDRRHDHHRMKQELESEFAKKREGASRVIEIDG